MYCWWSRTILKLTSQLYFQINKNDFPYSMKTLATVITAIIILVTTIVASETYQRVKFSNVLLHSTRSSFHRSRLKVNSSSDLNNHVKLSFIAKPPQTFSGHKLCASQKTSKVAQLHLTGFLISVKPYIFSEVEFTYILVRMINWDTDTSLSFWLGSIFLFFPFCIFFACVVVYGVRPLM